MNDGRARYGPQSAAVSAAHEIASPDAAADGNGQVLVTTHLDVIKQWAQERGLLPATDAAGAVADNLGGLYLVAEPGDLQVVTWTQWLTAFDRRRLNFLYKQTEADGSQSMVHRIQNPGSIDPNSAEALESMSPQRRGYGG